MIKHKAYKYRFYPNKEQADLIDRTIGCVRFIYNLMLNDKFEYYQSNKKTLKNTPAQYKKEYPFLKEVDSMALCNAQINLEAAYNNYFKQHKAKKIKPLTSEKLTKLSKKTFKSSIVKFMVYHPIFPKFKSKKQSNLSYTTNNQKGTIRLENNKIKLPKIGFVNLKLHRQIPEYCKLKSATITKTRTNKYYISILVEYETQVFEKKIEKVIGLDFSMKELFVSSDGNSANFPRFFREGQDQLAKEQRKLSHRKYQSKRYEKQRLKVARLHEYVANQRKDFLHKESRKLADNYDLVCIEDLNMQAMSQSLNFGKSVSDNGWGFFTTILKYKLEDLGKQLVKIDKWFPSSKMCNKCGAVNESLKLSDRTWTCDCGAEHERDVNAAINIRTVGMTGIAQECLCQ